LIEIAPPRQLRRYIAYAVLPENQKANHLDSGVRYSLIGMCLLGAEE
jgi:hypothetical protein